MGTATEAREARDELHEYCTNDVKLTAHLALLHEPYLRRNIEITENTNILGGGRNSTFCSAVSVSMEGKTGDAEESQSYPYA